MLNLYNPLFFILLQYLLSNLNAFIILISYRLSLYALCIWRQYKIIDNLIDKNNSPIQLINQVKGYFHINHLLALSLAITIFSFVGIPPLIGILCKTDGIKCRTR